MEFGFLVLLAQIIPEGGGMSVEGVSSSGSE